MFLHISIKTQKFIKIIKYIPSGVSFKEAKMVQN